MIGPHEDFEIRNEAAEWSAIRCCMVCRNMPSGLTCLVADDFRAEDTRAVWQAMQAIHGTGKRITYQEIENALGAQSALHADITSRATGADPKCADNYSMDILDASMRRTVVSRCRIAAALAIDPKHTPQEALEALKKTGDRFRQVRHFATIGETLDKAVKYLETPKENLSFVSVLTGIAKIDNATCGIPRGLVTILAGRPGTGKSTLAMNIAVNAAKSGVNVLYVSLEDVEHYLGLRVVSYLSGVDYGDLTHHKCDDWQLQAVRQIAADYRELPMRSDFLPRQTAASIRLSAISEQQKHGLDLLIVDHLTEMASDHNAYASTSEQVKGIRDIAKELNCAVLLLCQLNRSAANRSDPEPKVTDLRDSGKIEEVARNIWLLHRDQSPAAIKGVMQLDIAKATHGEVGPMDLRCELAHMRID